MEKWIVACLLVEMMHLGLIDFEEAFVDELRIYRMLLYKVHYFAELDRKQFCKDLAKLKVCRVELLVRSSIGWNSFCSESKAQRRSKRYYRARYSCSYKFADVSLLEFELVSKFKSY